MRFLYYALFSSSARNICSGCTPLHLMANRAPNNRQKLDAKTHFFYYNLLNLGKFSPCKYGTAARRWNPNSSPLSLFFCPYLNTSMRLAIFSLFLLFLTAANPICAQVVEGGLGTSSLLGLRYGQYDAASDSFADQDYAQVFSEKVYDEPGELAAAYSILPPAGFGIAHIVEKGDVDGDGMDDIAVVWGTHGSPEAPYESSILKIYNGFSGGEIYSYPLADALYNEKKVAALSLADFDGDGREELICILSSADPLRNQRAIFTLVDPYESTIRENFLATDLTDSSISSLHICEADFDGDHRDDLGLAYTIDWIVRTEVVVSSFLIDRGIRSMTHRSTLPGNRTPGNMDLHAADLYGNGRFDLIVALNTRNQDGRRKLRSELLVIDATGAIKFFYQTAASAPAEEITAVLSGAPSAIGAENLAVIKSIKAEGHTYSSVVLYDLPNNSSATIYSTPAVAGTNSSIYLGLCEDFDFDGASEIVVVEHAGPDGDGDGVPDASKLSMRDFSGALKYHYGLGEAHAQEHRRDKILALFSGNFNNDASRDLGIVHARGKDFNNDGWGDENLCVINDIAAAKALFVAPSAARSDSARRARGYVVLDNHISDEKLLRAINMESSYHDLSTLRTLFEEHKTKAAISELYRFFKERKAIAAYDKEDWYYDQSTDILLPNLKKFSPAAAKEVPCFGCHDNVYKSFTAAGRRIGRLLSTFLYRLDSGDRIDEEKFIATLKTLYAQMIWKSRERHATVGTNHGALFELDSYIPASIALNLFKHFDAAHYRNWLDVLDARLRLQVDHVLEDGVHDEHSIYYSYRMALSFSYFLALFAENQDGITPNQETLAAVRDAIRKLNYYMIYAIKPLWPKLDEHKVFTASDIPAIGDSKALWVKNFGKVIPHSRFDSFLNKPIALGYAKYWDDENLLKTLKFVANPHLEKAIRFDLPPTRFFARSGIFIARSNWLKEDGLSYDTTARYCYFKGGEMVPTPGPYHGYATSSHHAHADLLSVELSAYDENLIAEAGGHIFRSNGEIIDNLDRRRYTELYGYESKFDDFLTARHYFKGTAAHNTVYVNRQDQAKFTESYRWLGLSNIRAEKPEHLISAELDYYSAGISKDGDGAYAHRRDMYYIKPNKGGSPLHDYWLFIDRVRIRDQAFDNRVEQIWHLAPSQTLSRSEPEKGLFATPNMVVIAARDESDYPMRAQVIDTYNLTDDMLIDSKALKFAYEGADAMNFSFATIILPSGQYESVRKVHFDPLAVSGDNVLAGKDDARAYKLSFAKMQPGGKREHIEDYIFISTSPQQTFSWSPTSRSTAPVATDKKFEFHRFVNGQHEKKLSLDWGNLHGLAQGTAIREKHTPNLPGEVTLAQNYPNPFNSSTTLYFTLPQKDFVELSIYALNGQKLITLIRGMRPAGTYALHWDGRDARGRALASGAYLYRLRTSAPAKTNKLTILR